MAFTVATGQLDVATLRISQYIHENPYPVDTFEQQGMAIDEKQGHSIGIRLLLLSQQLIKAFDREFYHALIENTDWESLFRIHWFKEGDVIMSIGDEPNGIYYLARGDVRVQDAGGKTIAQLSDGDIFGEMAYFTDDRRRSATVVAMTDIAVRRISTEDFERTSSLSPPPFLSFFSSQPFRRDSSGAGRDPCNSPSQVSAAPIKNHREQGLAGFCLDIPVLCR